MIQVYGASVEFLKFSAGEPHVKVTNIGDRVQIHWNFEGFEELMYVAMICDVLASKGKYCTLVMPYIPFGRQDRATTPEQPFSLEIFRNFLKTIPIGELEVCDPHSDVFEELFNDLPFDVWVSTQVGCLDELLDDGGLKYDCVIAPDKGAMKKAKQIADGLLVVPLICATKVRDPLTGQLSSPTIDFGDLKPKRALIPDDILDKGGTFLQLADTIKKQFPDIKLDLYITHGIFAAGIDCFKGKFENIYCYNIMNKEITSGDLVNLSRLP